MRRLTVVLACLLPSALHASDPYTEFFTPMCQNTGLGTSCADVRMRVTNNAQGSLLQMWLKVTSNPGGSYLGHIYFAEKQPGTWGFDNTEWKVYADLAPVGHVGTTGAPGTVSTWMSATSPTSGPGIYFNPLGLFDMGIAGCTMPTGIANYWQQCDALGLDGWLLIAVQTPGTYGVQDVNWQVNFFRGTPATTTPEPRTFALLGTGLLALAGVRRLAA
jgi:hypothetical protein